MFSQTSKKVSTANIELNVRFLVPPKVIFDTLTDVRAAQYYTQSPCRIVPQVGGDYFLYNDGIQGQFISASCEKIELKWRRREWDEGVYSIATISFVEIDNAVTELHIAQNGIPKYDRFGNVGVVDSVRSGWIDMIFRKIGMVMGYVFQTEDQFE